MNGTCSGIDSRLDEVLLESLWACFFGISAVFASIADIDFHPTCTFGSIFYCRFLAQKCWRHSWINTADLQGEISVFECFWRFFFGIFFACEVCWKGLGGDSARPKPAAKKPATMPFFHRTAAAWWIPGLSKMPRGLGWKRMTRWI